MALPKNNQVKFRIDDHTKMAFKRVLEKSLEHYSTYAIYMNYDVIQVDVEDYKRLLNITDVDNLHPYYIILNRGKVIVKE